MPTFSIARVVFNLPLAGPFDYRIPEEAMGRVQPGARVLAPFGRQRLVGYVTALAANASIPLARVRTFSRLLDEPSWFTEELWSLADWVAQHHGVSQGEALATIVPTRLPARANLPKQAGLPPRTDTSETIAAPSLPHRTQDAPSREPTGLIGTARRGVVALEAADPEVRAAAYHTLIDATLARGRSALWLVPEIALAAHLIDACTTRWGSAVAVLHGRTTPRRRATIWDGLHHGAVRVVLGTRSAIFAPLAAPGLFIVDDEQDASYKHPEMPAYHARTVAIERARRAHALVVLGGHTLSVETWQAAARRRYRHVRLPAPAKPAVRVDVIDAREQRRGWPLLFSVALEETLRRTLEHHGQALLVLNRRGFATWIHCKTCKTVLRCPACGAALVYHFARKELVCHTCQSRQPVLEICPVCQGRYLRYQGLGTEKVVSETCRLFPGARVARLDLDVTRHDARVAAAVVGQMARREIDVLVGTQLVTRLPATLSVPLVGVISADTALHVPDFRAGERTFALLRGAIARATERVIIQTTTPTHEAIRAAARHEPALFYRDELRTRRTLGLPPFRQLVRLVVAGKKDAELTETCGALIQRFEAIDSVEAIGPAPVLAAQHRGTHRLWQVLLKGRRLPPLLEAIRRVIGVQRRFQGWPVRVDVDPY